MDASTRCRTGTAMRQSSSHAWASRLYARIRQDQVRQLVDNERAPPTIAPGFVRQSVQERPPVRVLDVRETREPPRDGRRQVASLHWRRRPVRHGVEAVPPPGPLDQEPRLAHSPASPEDGEATGAGERRIEAAHLVRAIDECLEIWSSPRALGRENAGAARRSVRRRPAGPGYRGRRYQVSMYGYFFSVRGVAGGRRRRLFPIQLRVSAGSMTSSRPPPVPALTALAPS